MTREHKLFVQVEKTILTLGLNCFYVATLIAFNNNGWIAFNDNYLTLIRTTSIKHPFCLS